MVCLGDIYETSRRAVSFLSITLYMSMFSFFVEQSRFVDAEAYKRNSLFPATYCRSFISAGEFDAVEHIKATNMYAIRS